MAAPYVSALMYFEAPIAYPVARLLDYCIGESHGVVYKKAELRTFVSLHGQIGGESLSEEEVGIISSVLELADKSVYEIMTPLEDAYVLSADTVLDSAKVDEIIQLGHSRIPVHSPGHFTRFEGMLLVKKLAAYDPHQALPVSSFPLNVLPETSRDATCFDALNYFQQGKSHLLLVSDTPGREGGAIGLVSMEDVTEELLGSETVDETDVYIDVHKKNKVVRTITPGRVTASRVSLSMGPLISSALDFRSKKRSSSVSSSSSLFSPAGGHAPERKSQDGRITSHSHHASTSSPIPLNTFPPRPSGGGLPASHAKALSSSIGFTPPPAPNSRVVQPTKRTTTPKKQFIFPTPVVEEGAGAEEQPFALGGDDEEDGEEEVRRMTKGEKRASDEQMLMSMNSPLEKGWS